MKPAFIIVLYKTPVTEVSRLNKEINKIGFNDYKIITVDNSKNNQGYGSGINQGIKKALKLGYDCFIVLNPDISFKQLNVKDFEVLANNFDIGGFVTQQNGVDYFGGQIDPWSASGGLIKQRPSNKFTPVDFVSGSLMVINKEVIEKIGFFDETYFMYYEEVDFCLRARQSGFRVGIDAQAKYMHFESKSNKDKDKWLNNSYIKFTDKHANLGQKFYILTKKILKSPFVLNFMSMNVSSVVIKLLHFFNFIFLIKYLNASEYGIYTLVWAQVLLLSPLLDFGTTSYSMVNFNDKKKHDMQTLFNFRFFISIIIFISTILLSLIFFRGNTKVYLYIFVTSTIIFTNTFSGSYFIYNALKSKLYISSRNSILFNLLVVAGTIISLFLYQRLLIVFVVIFVSYNGYTLANIFFLKNELGKFTFQFNLNKWLEILKQSYIYVLISFFAGLYFKIDVFLLTILKGINEVGIYSAGYKFFDALLFIATSYNVTAGPILARIANNKVDLLKKITKDIFFLSLIGILIVLGIWMTAPILLPVVLMKSYSSSISVLNIVILALPFILINSVMMNVLYVFKRAYFVIIIFAVQSVINISLNLLFIPRFSYFGSAWITVVSEVINSIFLLLTCLAIWNKVFSNKKT